MNKLTIKKDDKVYDVVPRDSLIESVWTGYISLISAAGGPSAFFFLGKTMTLNVKFAPKILYVTLNLKFLINEQNENEGYIVPVYKKDNYNYHGMLAFAYENHYRFVLVVELIIPTTGSTTITEMKIYKVVEDTAINISGIIVKDIKAVNAIEN